MRNGIAYIVIVLAVAAIAYGGGLLTQQGMDWYRTLDLPAFTPPGAIIGMVWTVIYIMSAIAAMLIWGARRVLPRAGLVITLLVINGVLNLMWTWLFFTLHQLGLAVVEMIVLNLTNLAIILLCWKPKRLAAVLFIPYFAWVCFATYLAIVIWLLNN